MNKDKILNLRKDNKNSKEIAELLHISKLEIDLFLVEHYYNSRSKLSLKQWKQIIIDRHNNKSFQQISQDLSISDSAISQQLKKWGIYFFPYNYFDYSRLTKEKIQQIVNDFKSGIPVYKLVQIYGFHKNSLAEIINSNGGNTMLCSFNEHIFDSIDTEEKAYWLGFLYADGAVSSRDNGCELSLQLLDAHHLYKFKQFLNSSSNIRLDFKIGRCRITISNKYFHNKLIELGCTPRKSLTLKFPSTDIFKDQSLIRHFIRGYFDGDGCFSHTYSDTKKQRITVSCNYIGTFEFLKVLEQFLQDETIKCSWYKNPKHKNNTYILSLNKTNSVKMLNYVYSDANIYLDRKYNLYLFFAKYDNFAVSISDYREYKRAISKKAKLWINNYFNINYETEHANVEITKKVK